MAYIKQRRKPIIIQSTILCVFLLQCIITRSASGPEVFSIDPHFGSACGETRITILGKSFSQNKMNEGNKVELVSATTSYECLVNKDGTMEDSIMCYTVPDMVEGVYTVKVTVDNVPVPDEKLCKTGGSVDSDCQFEVRKQNTPLINSVKPVAFPPGPESILEMRALMFTDRYTTNVATSSNGREETLNRVYAGPLPCDLIKTGETDELYGLQLDSAVSDFGTMKCRYQGNFIGNSNASFIVGGGPFGRSCRNLETLLVSVNKQIYQFQTYAEITGVSPATGSTSGGTTLKIMGNYFTGNKEDTEVYVGGVSCKVTSVSDAEIQCVTPPKPATLPTYFCGNRGLTLEVWTGQTKAYADLGDIEALTSSDTGYSLLQTGQSYFSHSTSNYVSRARGFFTAPYSGEYSFTIKSADVSSLRLSTDMDPANKVEVAKCEGTCPEYSSTQSQTSNRVMLTEQQKYYMEILHSHGSSGDPSVQVAAQFYNTKLTNQSTGIADVEHQLVKVTSTVVREVQKISLEVAPAVGAITNEIQVVEVKELSGQYSDATFRLGQYGVYTEALNTNMDGQKIAVAVQSLPWYGNGDDLVGVTKTVTTSPEFKVTLRIQFFTRRGDIPSLQYLVSDGSQGEKLEIQVTEETKGGPEPYTVALQMEGIISPVVPAGSTVNDLIREIDQMFTTRCPKYLGETGTVHISFETNTPQGGQIIDDKEAFCGRRSVKNPSYLYLNNDGLLLGSAVNTICFAYHGAIAGALIVKYSYKAGEDMTSVDNQYKTFSINIAEESEEWKYTCFDMLTALTNLVTDGQLFKVHYIRASRAGDVYIDEVYIGNGPSTNDPENVSLLRLKPVKPNGHVIHHTEGVVTSNGPTVFTVEITFIPQECGYDFPLFSIVSGQINALTGTVERVKAASPPVTGTFTLNFGGTESAAISPTVTSEEFKEILMSTVPAMGEVYTYKHGDCANFDLSVAFLSKPGDLEAIQYTSQLSGENVTIEIETVVNGKLNLDPIQGDMLCSYSTSPQVAVFNNEIPTQCAGNLATSCSFVWEAASTPVINSCTGGSGTFTISGSGFSTNQVDNMVTIAGVECTVTSSSETEITCTPGQTPSGTHTVDVIVTGKGKAAITSGATCNFVSPMTVSSVTPDSCSIGGGCEVSIQGTGFSSEANVSVGGGLCEVLSATYNQITCVVPSSTTAGQQTLTVSLDGQSATGFFTYSAGPIVDDGSIALTQETVNGGLVHKLTLTGSGWGDPDNVKLFVDGKEITPLTLTATTLEATFPLLSPGTYQLWLLTDTGYAVDSTGSIPSISVQVREITNVFPATGSLRGGTTLTITGQGFSPVTLENKVKVGDHNCDIKTSTTTELKCQIADTGKIHHITNEGIHPDFRISGYAWKPKHLEISVGDRVSWSWQFKSFIQGMKVRVVQVKELLSQEEVEGGFNSGPATTRGAYQFQFLVPGTYYYWSDFVDFYKTTQFSGVIEVLSLGSYTAEVQVMVQGIEFSHVKPGTADPSPVGPCPGGTGDLGFCNTPTPPTSNANRWNFAFWECATPTVTGVSRNEGTTFDTITVTGQGISNNICELEVKFGDNVCSVKGQGDGKFDCCIDSSNSPTVGLLQEISVLVKNRGFALLQTEKRLERSFALVPAVKTISPSSGSTAGGTPITITGTGFTEDKERVVVTIGGYICPVKSTSFTQITCLSSAQIVGTKTIEVKVITNTGIQVMAICKHTSGSCVFSYATSMTPELTSVNPESITGTSQTTLTLTGTNLKSTVVGATVHIGNEECAVQSQTVDTITCTITNLPLGQNAVRVSVSGFGSAVSSLEVASPAVISSLTPSSGSVYGGTVIHVQGNGFTQDANITIGGVSCQLISATLSDLQCTTGAHAAETSQVDIQVGSETYPQETFTYSEGISPKITSISPNQGNHGVQVTISGQNLSPVQRVTIGEAECTVVSSTATEITCTTTPHAVGPQSVVVHTNHGISNGDIQYEYTLGLSAVNPSSGSIYGGQTLTVSGSGFDENAELKICDEICPIESSSLTPTEFSCLSPPSPDESVKTCDVVLTSSGEVRTLSSGYSYQQAKTATLTGLSPLRGGTGGGTPLTITGSGFGSNEEQVVINGSSCSVTSWTDTQIVCNTDQHTETGKYKVSVTVPGNGLANPGGYEFFYVDIWSSTFTWENGILPKKDELVVIKEGHTVLLDISPPVLDTLLIDGGNLVFDTADIELQAQRILITKGGKLQVGTTDAPFPNKAQITLHGHVRSKELPVYGTKMIGVRNGSLELHGQRVVTTWTRLQTTAAAGATEIVLTHPVDWKVNDVIVIATTGHRHTQQQTEQHTISSISADGRTLTLTQPLEYEHVGVLARYGEQDIELRAEVGILTRNIVIQGTNNEEWNDPIEACPDGFDTGEFARRRCFQGLFGEEMGTDQFGAHVILHAPRPNTGSVVAHIEYVEFNYVGQAFRLGRYPVHFHINGNMTGSYVRGCSFHKSFNRVVNVHGTDNVLVEYNVAYDTMGGAVFLEDGIETGNTLQYNLLLFVKASSSLQNDDNSPAAFWVTNPDNTVRHNAAAGGTHFGFWYRMHKHPSGPSFTTSICPQNVPVDIFFNNTVHSNGWFGLWVFQTFTPRVDGSCSSKTPQESLFSNLTVWNCEKGAEIVEGGSVKLKNFVLLNNELAGYEGKMVAEGSQVIEDALIIARATELNSTGQKSTKFGIKLPYKYNFHVRNVQFVNFDDDDSAAFGVTRITGTCSVNCGGYLYTTEGLTFVNSPNRGKFFWAWEALIKDLDGSLISNGPSVTDAGKIVLPMAGTLPPTCTSFPAFSFGSSAAVVCPDNLKFHRFTFNKAPRSLDGKDAIFTNQYGSTNQPFRSKAITHKQGWLMVFLDGEEYTMEFQDNPGFTNFSYKGRIDNFETKDEYVIIKQSLDQQPSRVFFESSSHIPKPDTAIDPVSSSHGHWEYVSSQLKYIVRGHDPSTTGATTNKHVNINFNAYKCFFPNCQPPPDPNTVPPLESRPNYAVLWSEKETWADAEEGWGGNKGNGTYDLPVDGDSVKIPKDKWVVGDMTLPQMEKLVLYGVLELDDDNGNRDFELRCKYIVIYGGRLIIGWPDKPFLANALVILEGDKQTENYKQDSGPTIGAKVLAAFGGVDMHGLQKNDSWTRLAQTASPGDTQITLDSTVEWVEGDEIIIAPTGYKLEEVERFTITGISGNSITLDGPLQYKHIAHTHTANGKTMTMAAEVGRLTRNIRFEGAVYPDIQEEAFGARMMVSRMVKDGQLHIGYARLSNVEFRYTGQEGYVERGDSRSSLAFTDAGTVSNIKPSAVQSCSFHKSFAPAITIHGTNKLPVEWNVMADSVWFALETTSAKTKLSHNFVTNVQWEGCFNGRFEALNVRYNGAFNLNHAKNLVLEYNAVGGAQRIGYNILGEECGETAVWKNNVAHTTLIGVANIQLQTPIPAGMDCVQINNFEVWKNLDYGIYYNNLVNTVIKGIKAADNGVNIFQFIIGPHAVQHLYEDKFAKVEDAIIIGTSDAFDCTTDVPNTNDCNIKLSKQSRAHSGSRRLGVTMPTFSSGGNKATEKPLAGIKAYQAIGGRAYVSDVTFSKFGDRCSNGRDIVIAPNFKNDDGNHRMETTNLVLVDVEEDSKVFYPRSDLGKINPSDCVDMACDAKIKTLLVDKDSSFLEQAGAVIPQSEFQWNGDPAYGLGDYRVPKEMQTTLDGERISIDTLAPHKGIIRDNSCSYVSAWQAYKCPNSKHYTLTIESLDKDTETRRISPVAILGNGYLDLINGPQDHGWCMGYTCRKRLSTFQAIVSLNQNYLLHYTGTSPQNSRFMMLDVEQNDCIQLSIWYSQPWRLDVYHENVYIMPKNARHVGDMNTIVYDPPPVGEPDKFKPSAATCVDKSGSNFYDRDAGVLTILIKGPKPVSIVTVDSIIVSFQFPPMTLDEFYGKNIIMNLAAFLDIDPNFVRITDIQRETQERRRRRNANENIEGATIEISNPPGTPVDSSSLTSDDLQKTRTDIINAVQLTNLTTDTLSLSSGTSVSVSREMPVSDSPEWQQMTGNGTDGYVVIQKADHMTFHTELEPLHEGTPFKKQPKIQVRDSQGEIITMLGAEENTWKISASIRENTGNPDAVLLGTTTVQFVNGMATFTDLAISHFGTDYILDFAVNEPEVGEPFMIASQAFTLPGRPIVGAVKSKPPIIVERSSAPITLELRDRVTDEIINDIDWRGHSWTVAAEIGMSELYDENIMDPKTTTFDVNSGQASFNDLLFFTSGVYVIRFNITSDPADYNIELQEIVVVRGISQQGITTDTVKEIGLKFDANFDNIVGESRTKYFSAMVLNWVANNFTTVIPEPKLVYKGSIMVTFNLGGNEVNVTSTISDLCIAIQNGTDFIFVGQSLTLSGYMTVDGNKYYGVSCGVISSNDGTDSAIPIIAVVAAVGGLLLIAVIILIACMLHKSKVAPKTKTHDLKEVLYNEKSFTSIRKQYPPHSTTLTGEKRTAADYWKM
ncbi:fibrocystin-L-like [Saccostrea echinata]|uniref:fibrocystin-L-like n=1 Tax=Saccostrea echinata TaxID=191078 RepID=UPI002A8013A4|nr:fibrocystin-L-like [Saccostrea echinata]